jgi:DNA-binding NarL/FixJ family response regulator
MRRARAATRRNRITLHVVEPHALAMLELRRILKRFHRTDFHGGAPLSLTVDVPLILVVDDGTLGAPLGELLRRVRLGCPKASVIVLNREGRGDYLMELLFLGVEGFVAYDRAPEELADAIDTVARGGAWMDTKTLQEFGRHKLLLTKGQHKGILTEREMTVLGLLKRGLCSKEIAAALGRSVPTVKFHLRNIYTKLGVHDRVRALERAKLAPASESALGDAAGG